MIGDRQKSDHKRKLAEDCFLLFAFSAGTRFARGCCREADKVATLGVAFA